MSALLDDVRRVVADVDAGTPRSAATRAAVLAHLDVHGAAALGRDVPEHVTASALVLDASLTRALLCFHRKGRFWVQPGGHLDPGDSDLLAAALREMHEETGVAAWTVPTARAADLDRHALGDGFGRCAWHLDVGFVVLADPAGTVAVSDESTDVAWWPLDALPDEVPPGLGDRLARAAAFARAEGTGGAAATRRDARVTAGPYAGRHLVAEADESGSVIALVCDGEPGSLRSAADLWFADVAELELGVTEGGWDVEWLPPGSLGAVDA